MKSPTTTTARAMWLVLAALSFGSCEDKTPEVAVVHRSAHEDKSPENAVFRCEHSRSAKPEALNTAVEALRLRYTGTVLATERTPDRADVWMREYRLDFERYMAPLLTDMWVSPSGLLPSEPPSTLAEAAEQLAALEAALPKLHEHLEQQRSACIAEMTADPIQGMCKVVRRKIESFSLLCARLGRNTDPGEGDSGNNYSTAVRKLLGSELDFKAHDAMSPIAPTLWEFLDEVKFPVWTEASAAEWSTTFGAALRHRKLIVRIAASLAPPECGIITVECPL